MKTLVLAFAFLICSAFCTPVNIHGQFVESRQCFSGYIEFANFRSGGVLVVEEELIVDNLNLNQVGSVVITKTGKLTVKSSINLNGSNYVENYGTLIAGNVEIQGDGARFTNKGIAKVNEVQLSHEKATLENCGELFVSNFTNIHAGTYTGCNCSTLTTGGLNINKANAFLGLGHIKVTGNLNLNHVLSQSPYKLCYSGNINQPEKLGGAKLDCDFSCSDSPLPLVVGKVSTRKVPEGYEVSIPVLSAYSIKEVRVQVSLDSVTWRTVKLISPTDLEAGKTYKTIITL